MNGRATSLPGSARMRHHQQVAPWELRFVGITNAITTGCAINPQDARHQSLQRLVDTVVGVGVCVASKWAASILYFRIAEEAVRRCCISGHVLPVLAFATPSRVFLGR